MARFDLDAARAARDAARAEAQAEPKEIVFGGEVFELPVELPYEFADRLARQEAREALEALLGADFERFYRHGPSVDDVNALAEGIVSLYGISMGEAEASPSSSLNGSRQSRQTSLASIA